MPAAETKIGGVSTSGGPFQLSALLVVGVVWVSRFSTSSFSWSFVRASCGLVHPFLDLMTPNARLRCSR